MRIHCACYLYNNYSINNLCLTDRKFYKILTCGKLEKKGPLVSDNGELRITELLRKYYMMDCTNEEKLYPIAIYPPHLDEQMSAQQACFTLFGNIVQGLEWTDSKESFLECIFIDAESKHRIVQQLRILGISNYSIYPDLDGLGRAINFDHSNDIGSTREKNDLSNFFNNID
jgi:hypothetical protein